MKQVIFNFGELSIVCNIPGDFCTIFKMGIPIWAGDHNQLIELLQETL